MYGTFPRSGENGSTKLLSMEELPSPLVPIDQSFAESNVITDLLHC